MEKGNVTLWHTIKISILFEKINKSIYMNKSKLYFGTSEM